MPDNPEVDTPKFNFRLTAKDGEDLLESFELVNP
jgi:hypothetical protein